MRQGVERVDRSDPAMQAVVGGGRMYGFCDASTIVEGVR